MVEKKEGVEFKNLGRFWIHDFNYEYKNMHMKINKKNNISNKNCILSYKRVVKTLNKGKKTQRKKYIHK